MAVQHNPKGLLGLFALALVALLPSACGTSGTPSVQCPDFTMYKTEQVYVTGASETHIQGTLLATQADVQRESLLVRQLPLSPTPGGPVAYNVTLLLSSTAMARIRQITPTTNSSQEIITFVFEGSVVQSGLNDGPIQPAQSIGPFSSHAQAQQFVDTMQSGPCG